MSEGGVQRRTDSCSSARYRSQRLCILVVGTRRDPVRLGEISATGARLGTNARPALGEVVRLLHPEAGAIEARVAHHSRDGVALSFELSDESVAFAMRALTVDMTV